MGENKKKKHLHELLEDDQEPFQLNHYISNLRSQMGYSNLHLKKHQKSNKITTFPPSLFSCDDSCFLTSPDPRKSPLFELKSPVKKKTHIPAILLEAAARIQKQGKSNKARTRGMFGSVLGVLRNRKGKPRLDNADGNVVLERGLESTSSSGRREGFIEIDDKCFCESPFRLVLQMSPCSTSGHRTPHFTSPVTSPARHNSVQDKDRDETERLEKVRGQEDEDKEEQCSPVSVLDPLEEEEEEDEEDHQQLHEPDLISCSFEVVQRAKRRLLKKLRRFEKLAGLEQVDLEGKMSEEEEEEYQESEEEENTMIYDSDEEFEDINEAMARDRGCAEKEQRKKNDEERLKKWRMVNAWRVGLGTEEDVDEVVRKDIREEVGEWTRHREEVEEAVSDLEVSIFFVLIDEFSNEFVSSCS